MKNTYAKIKKTVYGLEYLNLLSMNYQNKTPLKNKILYLTLVLLLFNMLKTKNRKTHAAFILALISALLPAAVAIPNTHYSAGFYSLASLYMFYIAIEFYELYILTVLKRVANNLRKLSAAKAISIR